MSNSYNMSRILLIDDDQIFRTMLSATLAQFGHTVFEARDGKEGLTLFPLVHPELIITDLVMPEMEGIGVLLELKRRHAAAKVMVVSGGVRGNTVDVLDIAKRLGASKVLAKPFTSEALLAAVSELLPAAAV